MRAGRWRLAVMVCCILAICLVSSYMIHIEKSSCMGVPVLTEKERNQFSEYEYLDFSPYLFFKGEKAAIDIETSTIYISQALEKQSFWDLQGDLRIELPQYKLYFEQSADFEQLSDMMNKGRTLKLLISDGSSKYMEYKVVLTNLPVVRMEGLITAVNEQQRDVFSGDFCLWASNDSDTDSYTVKTTELQWHIRGNTSSVMPKKSWKLSLKNRKGNNQNMSLLGLGSDDDWILNSMSLDDTQIKEKLTIDLWNDMANLSNGKMKMADGEYAEVVVNGEYMGLYLLQRRIDTKYLELGKNDILIKGKQNISSSIYTMFDIIHTPLSLSETYELVEKICDCSIYNWSDADNFIDCNLMLNFTSAIDNIGYKNMYFVFVYENGGYRLHYIPWDTDMSYGILSVENGFVYDYNTSMGNTVYRMEYNAYSQEHPEFIKQMQSRWSYLRSNILSNENIDFCINKLEGQLTQSGAYNRDKLKWGVCYGENDTVEALRKYIAERVLKIDNSFVF